MNRKHFWIAAILSGSIHCGALAAVVIIALQPTYQAPELLDSYGDSDREGFPVTTVAVNPGAWQQGDEGTPGGDGEVPQPLTQDAAPVLSPAAPEPTVAIPATSAAPAPATDDQSSPEPTPSPPPTPAGSKQPGAPGGAKMAIGTPSAGGKVGSRSGVRMLDAEARPAYPEAARLAGIEGRPVYRLRISAEGAVLEVKLAKSCGHKILDDAGLRWLQNRRFKPARVGDTPVEAETPWAVDFYLY